MDSYDIGIIGAGIAGSCLALNLARVGYKVLIVEQHSYPKHKVCGEFVSFESYDYLCSLGLRLNEWDLPRIDQLELTSELGCELKASMEMGGFGISRYKLDFELAQLFSENGITFIPNTKIVKATKNSISSSEEDFTCDLVISAHGKYQAPYLTSDLKRPNKNYIGVKYHIKTEHPTNQISLHSFKGGYCGISQVENDTFCLCYLIDSKYLKKSSNSIKQMEKEYLFKNSRIKQIFEDSEFLWEKPVVISNVQFGLKQLSDDSFIYLGDAASSISPLSGNGMSIAAASAQLLSSLINAKEENLKYKYNKSWKGKFSSRVNRAKILNQIMLNPQLNHIVLKVLKANSKLMRKVINSMQGEKIQTL